MKFVVLSFYFRWFYLPVGLNFLTKVYIFQPMSKLCFLHIYLLLFFMLLSFYTQIFLIAPFLMCNYPLFFSHSVFTFSLLCPLLLLFLLSSLFSISFPPFFIFLGFLISIILLFFTVSPYSLPPFIWSLFLFSFIP